MVGDLAQGNSADAARTHALLVENFAEDDLEDERRSQQTTAHNVHFICGKWSNK